MFVVNESNFWQGKYDRVRQVERNALSRAPSERWDPSDWTLPLVGYFPSLHILLYLLTTLQTLHAQFN